MGKKITTLLMGMMLALALTGCGSKNNRYEGAGMSFKYEPSEWSIFYREANEENQVIELYSDKGGGLSIVSCQKETDSAEEIYQGMITSDQILGQVSGLSAQNNMSEKMGTAFYAHRTKTNFMNDYWTLFFGKNLGDGQVMLAAATIYIENEEDADQCRKEIEDIIASLKLSEKTDVGEITKAMIDPDVQTNVLVNYLNDGNQYYSYMDGSKAAEAKPISLDGFEYVEMVTLTDRITNQETDVYALNSSESYFESIFYYDHGINFSLFLVGDWLYMSPTEQLSSWMQGYVNDVNNYPSRYQNMVVDDLVTVEEGLCYYQHMSVEELDTRENATTNHALVYVGTASNGIGYVFSLQVTGSNTDGETNQILEELGKCYDLDLSDYGNSEDDLTNAGKRVNASQDDYMQKSDEPEIRKLDEYNYMGATEVSDYDDNIYELLIPMGQQTSNTGSSLRANMHGVGVSIYLTSSYGSVSVAESVQKSVQRKYDHMAENSRDYKELSIGEPATTAEGEGIYCAVSAEEHMAYDGLSFPYHEIYYELKLQGKTVLSMSLTLDEHDYDAKTNAVLEDLEQAYRMDLSEFYYEK